MSNIPQIFPIFNYNDFSGLENIQQIDTALNNDPNFGTDVYNSINANTTAINNLNSHYKYSGSNGYTNFDTSGNFTINNGTQELSLSNGNLSLTNLDALNQLQLLIQDNTTGNQIFCVPTTGGGGYNSITVANSSSLSSNNVLCLFQRGSSPSGLVLAQNYIILGSGVVTGTNMPSNYFYFDASGIGLNTKIPNYNLDINGSFHSTNFIRNHITNIIYNGGSGTSLSLNYTSVNTDIIFYNPTADFSFIISNLPTTLYQSYNFKLYLNAKYYCNSININGTAVSIIAVNGFSNISINASSTYILQDIQICFFSSTTPIVITNVYSLF